MNNFSVDVTVNFDKIKNYHTEPLFRHYFLSKKGEQSKLTIENVQFRNIDKTEFDEVKNQMKLLMLFNYNIADWQSHFNHFLYLTEVCLRNEIANIDFKRERVKQLRSILKTIIEIRKLKDGKKAVKSIVLGTSLVIKGELTAKRAVDAVENELIDIYNRSQINDHFPKLDEDLKTLAEFLKSTPTRSPAIKDLAIGQLCLILKEYLDDNDLLKSKDKFNFKNKKIDLAMSNEQGALIGAYLVLMKIIEEPNIQLHLRIRRYIYTFKLYEDQLQNSPPS